MFKIFSLYISFVLSDFTFVIDKGNFIGNRLINSFSCSHPFGQTIIKSCVVPWQTICSYGYFISTDRENRYLAYKFGESISFYKFLFNYQSKQFYSLFSFSQISTPMSLVILWFLFSFVAISLCLLRLVSLPILVEN